MEFPFAVPMTGTSASENVTRFAQMVALSLRTALGEPTYRGDPTAEGFPGRLCWSLPKAKVAIEARAGSSPPAGTVVLQIDRTDSHSSAG